MTKDNILPVLKDSKFTGVVLEAIKSILEENGYGVVQDTGWRDISSLITAPEFQTFKTQRGLLCARRVGSRCVIRFTPIFSGGPGLGEVKPGTQYTLLKKLPGFSPSFPKVGPEVQRVMWGVSTLSSGRGVPQTSRWLGWGVDLGDQRFTGLLTATDLTSTATLEYDTVDPFPAELPGTPIEFATPDYLK